MEEELLLQSQPEATTEEQTETTDDQSTDPTNAPSSPPVDREEIQILQTFARNASQQNQILQQRLLDMQQQLEGLNRSVAPTKPNAPIVTDDDFRESPAAAMDRLFDAKLEEKLNRTIAPLIQAQQEQQRERQFHQTFQSSLYALNPQLASYADQLAPEVRQFLGNAPPTPEAIQAATLMVVGKYVVAGSGIPSSQPPANPPVQNNSPSRPSTVPAAAPTSAPRSTPKNTPKLNESQLRAFNRLGYKPGQEQEFIDMLMADEVRF